MGSVLVTAAIPAERPRRSARVLRAVLGTAKGLAVRAVTPHKASLSRLADMPLTALGTAGINFAAFHVGHGWGWLVTGVSLIVVEHLIADEG